VFTVPVLEGQGSRGSRGSGASFLAKKQQPRSNGWQSMVKYSRNQEKLTKKW